MSSEAETTSAVATPVTPTKTPAGSGSAASTPSKETDEAMNQLVQGKRHLLVRDYSSAVTCLGKACELLAERFGDTAAECGDAYLSYGKALLELARSESGVLEMNESDKGDEEEDEEEEDGDDAAEQQGEDQEEGGKEETNGDAEKASDDKEPPSEETNGGPHAETDEGAKENGTKEEAEPTENEDDVNNLQLAWEMLELAKLVFQKQLEAGEDKQAALKLSEVHLKLGEVGVESENYSTAVEDMKSCLELQKKYLEDDDRRIAETLYTMGMAYSLSNDFEPAIEQFKAASEQIEKRIANLEAQKGKEQPSDKENGDAFYTVQGEIDELKALLPEMKEKVTDMKDFKKETLRRMMEKVAEDSAMKSSTADGAGPSSVQDKPVSSVAHLVKRKPKEEVKEGIKSEENATDDAKANLKKATDAEKVESPKKEEKKEIDDGAQAEKSTKDQESSEGKRKMEDAEEDLDAKKKAKLDEK